MNRDKFFPVSVAIIEDPKGNGYTASFREYEALVAEGDTEDQAVDNLFGLMRTVFKKNSKDHEMKIDNKEGTITVNAKIKSMNFG